MSRGESDQNVPRAMIHRRILDVAERNPDATLEAIAGEVSGASSLLVERVLDEYGDPADTTESASPAVDGTDSETVDDSIKDDTAIDDASDETADGDESDEQHEVYRDVNTNGQQTMNGSTEKTDPEITLSDKQRRTLRALYDHPEASQGDIAEALGVTRPTVSRRLNSIPGFEWSDRHSFARSVFEGDAETEPATEETADAVPNPDSGDSGGTAEQTTASESDRASAADESESDPESGGREGDSPDRDDEPGAGPVGVSEIRETLNDLDRRLSAVESDDTAETEPVTSDGEESDPDAATITLSPELAHKVVHACMNSERVSEDEEMGLLRALMQD